MGWTLGMMCLTQPLMRLAASEYVCTHDYMITHVYMYIYVYTFAFIYIIYIWREYAYRRGYIHIYICTDYTDIPCI